MEKVQVGRHGAKRLPWPEAARWALEEAMRPGSSSTMTQGCLIPATSGAGVQKSHAARH